MAALSISFQGAARTITGSRHRLRDRRLHEAVKAEVHVPAPGEEVAVWN